MINGFAIFEVLASQIPEHLFLMFEIGMMIIIAGVVGYLLKLAKQPLIPAYILAGILLGPIGANLIHNTETILVLSEIGVAFLLFFAGIEMNIKKLKEVGKAAAIIGTFQILILFGLAFGIALWFGLSNIIAVYIGLVVTFSSTMVVLKLLADKKELNSLHGRIVIGILLIQDIAAIIALTILTTDLGVASIGLALIKALIFVIIAFLLTRVINPIFKIAARNTELLLLTSITLLFIFALGSYIADLSLIIGAFFAGVVLATSEYRTEIQGKIMPIRDFFAVLFFVALGIQISFISVNLLYLMLILVGLAIIVKPLIIMMLTRLTGYSKRTSFLTGNSLAQTSEFSLIIATIGFSSGIIDSSLFSILVLVTVITMALTTYLIKYDKKMYINFGWPLNILKNLRSKKEGLEYLSGKGKNIIIFGCHRMGSLFLKHLGSSKKDVLVVDYNPEIIKSLISKKVSCVYGDYGNSEVLEKASLRTAKLVISTIPELEDNINLIRSIKKMNSKTIILMTAERIDDAEELYKSGADYVLLPQVVTGEHGFHLAKKLLKSKKGIRSLRSKKLKELKKIHHLLYGED